MTSDLASKSCVPCKGGIPALNSDEAKQMLSSVNKWLLNDASTIIEKRFTFDDFKQTLSFVNKVGALAEVEGHHPDISLGWGYCEISIHTHKIKGLHENDFILASKIDEI